MDILVVILPGVWCLENGYNLVSNSVACRDEDYERVIMRGIYRLVFMPSAETISFILQQVLYNTTNIILHFYTLCVYFLPLLSFSFASSSVTRSSISLATSQSLAPSMILSSFSPPSSTLGKSCTSIPAR